MNRAYCNLLHRGVPLPRLAVAEREVVALEDPEAPAPQPAAVEGWDYCG